MYGRERKADNAMRCNVGGMGISSVRVVILGGREVEGRVVSRSVSRDRESVSQTIHERSSMGKMMLAALIQCLLQETYLSGVVMVIGCE